MFNIYYNIMLYVVLPIINKYFNIEENNIFHLEEDEFYVNLVEEDEEGMIFQDHGVIEMMNNHLNSLDNVEEVRLKWRRVPGENYYEIWGFYVVVKAK